MFDVGVGFPIVWRVGVPGMNGEASPSEIWREDKRVRGSREGRRRHADGRGRVRHVRVQIGIQEEERCCEQECSGLEARGGSCARYGKRCRTPGQGQLPRFRSEISWVSRIWKWSACMADYRMITHRRSAFSSLCRHAAESYIMSPSKLILASPNILACPRHGVLPTIQTAS